MDIPALEAGRELDELIAVKVMGKTICEHSRTGSVAQGGGFAMCGDKSCKGELHYQYLPGYSTVIAAAMSVAFEMHRRGYEFEILVERTTPGAFCTFRTDALHEWKCYERECPSRAAGLALAICKCAVMAVSK